ncbi:glycosyltransferase family 4 protein [Nocardioides sp. LML1-1-1.1]|uniref:glycosyltransferase family 4 protein n=1 Tax=Nocardioides sp. LML1-1-1.1 TaxID=3135248 RepID=UPI003427B964
MRVLTVIAALGAGGAEAVAVELALAAAADGHEVRVASSPGFRVGRLREAGVEHVPLRLVGRRPTDLLASVRRLRALPAPDLVHAHNPKAALVARLAVGPRVPVLTTLHGVGATEAGHAARILRRTSDRVVVVSPHLREQLTRWGFPAERIEVVANTIEPLPSYPRPVARAELGLPADDPVALCLARMVDQKRHDLLVEAWAAARVPGTLLLAGSGPNESRTAAAVARHGVGAGVRLLGERTDVPRLLAASDVLVLPTRWEGLPISVLEAMGAGVPVVASRVSGVTEHFGSAARLVASDSVPELSTALEEVLGDPRLRDRMRTRGQEVLARDFGSERMVAAYRDLYAPTRRGSR